MTDVSVTDYGNKAAAPATVPDGFVQLPVEPTWETLCAMYAAPRTARDVYAAVVASASRAGAGGDERCTEPDRAACPRRCEDFCNAEEMRNADDEWMTPAPVAVSAAELHQLRAQNAHLVALYDAVANLIRVKGRHHTELAYARLVSAFDAARRGDDA